MSARRKYEMFHGHEPRYETKKKFTIPKNLIVLGDAIAIEYATDKFNGGGDGKYFTYRHEFESPALVCMDEKAGKQLYILGSQIKVTQAGIEN